MRRRPASLRSWAWRRNVEPFVVMATSVPSAASFATSSSRFARTMGSPPVRRMLSTPNVFTMTRASCSISSKVKMSARSSHSRPSSGMQYVHRKLQRSVTLMRRSRWTRPNVSTKGRAMPNIVLAPLANAQSGYNPTTSRTRRQKARRPSCLHRSDKDTEGGPGLSRRSFMSRTNPLPTWLTAAVAAAALPAHPSSLSPTHSAGQSWTTTSCS